MSIMEERYWEAGRACSNGKRNIGGGREEQEGMGGDNGKEKM